MYHQKLEATVLAVSDPFSLHYGKHLNLQQVQGLLAPASATLLTVSAQVCVAMSVAASVADSEHVQAAQCLLH